MKSEGKDTLSVLNIETEQLNPIRAALFQLIPGAASLPVYAILAFYLAGYHLPNIFALASTILIIEVPVTWAIIIRQVRRETNGRFSYSQAFPWNAPVSWWQYLLIGFPVIVFSVAVIGIAGPVIQEGLLNSVFGGIPSWFVMTPDPAIFSSLSREMLLTLWVLVFVAMVSIGGCTQELYARGFLLPRIEHLGRWAPAYNAAFFAVFHLIAPWNWPAFFIMTLPWAYLVWWRRSVKIGLFIHVGMLALQWIGLTFVVFGLVPAPN